MASEWVKRGYKVTVLTGFLIIQWASSLRDMDIRGKRREFGMVLTSSGSRDSKRQ